MCLGPRGPFQAFFSSVFYHISLYVLENSHILFCDPTYGPQWGKGVMDEELNIIIEPIYYGIFWHDGYYDVENFDQESAHFSSTGEQTTDFKPD